MAFCTRHCGSDSLELEHVLELLQSNVHQPRSCVDPRPRFGAILQREAVGGRGWCSVSRTFPTPKTGVRQTEKGELRRTAAVAKLK